MKKKLILVLTLSLSLFAVACGGKKESGPAESGAVSSAADSSAAANSEAGSKSGSTAASGAADSSQAATPAPDAAMATAFRALKKDMSYAEVEKLFGRAGTAGAAKGSYTWASEDGTGIVTVAFESDHLTNYSQVGVIVDKSAKATMEAYNQLKPEMSYDEAKALLGGDGVPVSTSYIAGQVISSYTWTDPDGLSFALTFSNDKLSAMNTNSSQ
mgnify:FL=1